MVRFYLFGAEGVDPLLVCICDVVIYYPFGVDPPSIDLMGLNPPIFILNHPRLQRMKKFAQQPSAVHVFTCTSLNCD